MSALVLVQIIGAPIACKGGVKDSWRVVAAWSAGQLAARFGDGVRVKYFDMFEPECPSLPEGAQLSLVLVNSMVVSSGEKISIPAIRRCIEGILNASLCGDQTSS